MHNKCNHKGVLFLLAFLFTLNGCIFANEVESDVKEMPGLAEEEYVPDELLVKFKEGVWQERIKEINENLKTKVVDKLEEGRLFLLKISPSDRLGDVMEAYKALPEVEYAEYNYIVSIE